MDTDTHPHCEEERPERDYLACKSCSDPVEATQLGEDRCLRCAAFDAMEKLDGLSRAKDRLAILAATPLVLLVEEWLKAKVEELGGRS